MKDILDEIENQPTEKRYSRLSFAMGIIALGLFGYLFTSIPSTISASEGFPQPSRILIVATQLTCLAGVVTTVLSFHRGEPTSWFKWVGAVLNLLLLVLIIGLVIFARLM